MTNAHEGRVNRTAKSIGYRLNKVGKGSHHGRFYIVNVAEGARIASDVPGAEFTFSLQEDEDWLAQARIANAAALTAYVRAAAPFSRSAFERAVRNGRDDHITLHFPQLEERRATSGQG